MSDKLEAPERLKVVMGAAGIRIWTYDRDLPEWAKDDEQVEYVRLREPASEADARAILADTYDPDLAHVRKAILETPMSEMGQWFERAIAAIRRAAAPSDRVKALEAALEPFAAMADELERVAGQHKWPPSEIRRSFKYDQCVIARDTLKDSHHG